MNNSFDNIQTEELAEYDNWLDEREIEMLEELEREESEASEIDLEETPF